MGLIAAVYRGTPVDAGVMVLGLIGISMPVFWLGEMVNLASQSRFHDTFLFSWVPPLGYVPFTVSPVGWFKALVLPWITLSILYIGIYARVLRSSLIESQSQDYVRTAHAKGLTGGASCSATRSAPRCSPTSASLGSISARWSEAPHSSRRWCSACTGSVG